MAPMMGWLTLEEPSDGAPWIWHAGLMSGVMGEIRKHAQRDVTWAFPLNGSTAAVNCRRSRNWSQF